ncbi:hypothetical protein HMPREF0501_01451 [Limosilactobacillus coleohominis 101-4-CHN]|uniref:Uncharacterized protein n=1 Tax=Limosilactobacillus coleohominis 101-4-CHN TaxID=575594 RepID=C7XXN7_9LACO|nr:hypothetical protein [Limosilactobacillus coleohominis]EEU29657.1 hypothetical protein HMPREF0501_01451 [Limosilactobacillus coleohominis 101-4-CHN]
MNKKLITLTMAVTITTVGEPLVANAVPLTTITAKASQQRDKVISAKKVRVGDQLKPGYYRITVPKGEATIEGDKMKVTIGARKSSNHVTSYTMELKKGDKLTINKKMKVRFQPIDHMTRAGQTDLTAGVWEVGTDLEPGNYRIAKTSNTNSGMVQVEDEANGQIENIPGNQGSSVVNQEVKLKKGQQFRTNFDQLRLVKAE